MMSYCMFVKNKLESQTARLTDYTFSSRRQPVSNYAKRVEACFHRFTDQDANSAFGYIYIYKSSELVSEVMPSSI